jgi:DNA-binding LacI/PurR family transcriptional regulator
MGYDGVSARPDADAVVPRAVAIFGSFRYGQYFEDILEGVVAAADVANTRVISIQTSQGVLASSYEIEGQDGVSRAGWDHFDGAIVTLQAVSVEYVAALRAAGKFVVAIGQDIRGTMSAIALDNAQGIRDAVTHLAGHGHTEIGFASPTWQADAVERYDAYAEQMRALGLTPGPREGADLSAELSLDEQGRAYAKEWLAQEQRPTAMLVVPDLITLGFIRGLQEAGVSVP